jgi:hypothetical protein
MFHCHQLLVRVSAGDREDPSQFTPNRPRPDWILQLTDLLLNPQIEQLLPQFRLALTQLGYTEPLDFF